MTVWLQTVTFPYELIAVTQDGHPVTEPKVEVRPQVDKTLNSISLTTNPKPKAFDQAYSWGHSNPIRALSHCICSALRPTYRVLPDEPIVNVYSRMFQEPYCILPSELKRDG